MNPRARRVINGNNVIEHYKTIPVDDFNERKAAVLVTFTYFVLKRAFYHLLIILPTFFLNSREDVN